MREILFRGKRLDSGEWIEGWYEPEVDVGSCSYHCGVTIACKNSEGWLDDHEVDPATVGQYTGLTDENGKKVFEGDIVRFRTRTCTFKPVYVRWDEETARFLVSASDGVRSYPMDRTWKYEVIGNIHDNPELLEGVIDA